jgi:hypothetical protein
MKINSKIQFIQITTKDVKLNAVATDTVEETEIKLSELKELLANSGVSYEGMDLADVQDTLTLTSSLGNTEFWAATQMDLQVIYESKDLNVYDLYITYNA